jgi:hypothetical protein
MGLDAQVIAIGPFSRSVLPALGYPASYYADVSEGQTVIADVFAAGTSAASHALAEAFGVGAMELGRHVLDPQIADIEKLTDFGSTEDFLLLRAHGFTFYFLPNG